jgi:hypothetical protein
MRSKLNTIRCKVKEITFWTGVHLIREESDLAKTSPTSPFSSKSNTIGLHRIAGVHFEAANPAKPSTMSDDEQARLQQALQNVQSKISARQMRSPSSTPPRPVDRRQRPHNASPAAPQRRTPDVPRNLSAEAEAQQLLTHQALHSGINLRRGSRGRSQGRRSAATSPDPQYRHREPRRPEPHLIRVPRERCFLVVAIVVGALWYLFN